MAHKYLSIAVAVLVLCIASAADAARLPAAGGLSIWPWSLRSPAQTKLVAIPATGGPEDDVEGVEEEKRVMLLAHQSGAWSHFPHPLTGADRDDDAFCHDRAYTKKTLKLIKETPFVGLFHDLKKQRRFEGSGMVTVDDHYYVIFDSLRVIGKVNTELQFRHKGNIIIGPAEEADSQYEGISYSPKTDTFIIVRESYRPPNDPSKLVPLTEEIFIERKEADYVVQRKCPIDFQLEDENKGFESIYYFDGDDKQRYIFGLCESNFCKTILGDDPPGLQRGNGRAVVGRLRLGARLKSSPVPNGGKRPVGPIGVEHTGNDDDCVWEFVKEVKIPESAYFVDYAGFTFKSVKGRRMAIVSQEDAAVWIGHFDWKAMEWEEGGKTYHLPRDNACNKVYCNVEGIQFIDEERIVLAGDAYKAAIQPWWCGPKDQTVSVFGLP